MAPSSTSPYLGMAVKTLAIWRSRGIGPPFCKLSGRIFYFKSVVDHWVAERSDLVSSAQAKTKDAIRKQQRNGKVGLKPTALGNATHSAPGVGAGATAMKRKIDT
jgi:hypothetical protein